MICGLCWFAKAATTAIPHVMIYAQVGKEFPDMRQNEREIKFIMGDAVRTMGQLKGEVTLNSPLLYPECKGWDRGLAGDLLTG